MRQDVEIVEVVPDSPQHYFAEIAELHRAEIEGGFLSTLGIPILTRLYWTFAASPSAIVHVAVSESQVCGFICASLDTKAVYGDVLRKIGISTALRVAMKVISWSKLKRMFETLAYPTKRSGQELPSSEILNFCVSRSHQRRGVGVALLESACQVLTKRGVRKVGIVTGAAQHQAQAFYEKVGAKVVGEVEVHEGAKSFQYVLDIGESTPLVKGN